MVFRANHPTGEGEVVRRTSSRCGRNMIDAECFRMAPKKDRVVSTQ